MFEPPFAKLYVRTHYPLVTRHSVLPQIIYAGHYGIFKQKSPAVAGKPRDTAAILFGLMFADDIHYKLKKGRVTRVFGYPGCIPY